MGITGIEKLQIQTAKHPQLALPRTIPRERGNYGDLGACHSS